MLFLCCFVGRLRAQTRVTRTGRRARAASAKKIEHDLLTMTDIGRVLDRVPPATSGRARQKHDDDADNEFKPGAARPAAKKPKLQHPPQQQQQHPQSHAQQQHPQQQPPMMQQGVSFVSQMGNAAVAAHVAPMPPVAQGRAPPPHAHAAPGAPLTGRTVISAGAPRPLPGQLPGQLPGPLSGQLPLPAMPTQLQMPSTMPMPAGLPMLPAFMAPPQQLQQQPRMPLPSQQQLPAQQQPKSQDPHQQQLLMQALQSAMLKPL